MGSYLKQGDLASWREKNKPAKCPILNIETDDWVVDHNHTTGFVRGVISRSANSFIGKIENFLLRFSKCKQIEFPNALRRAADYLEKGDLDFIHPYGLTQLTKRFKNNLTVAEQVAVLVRLGASEEKIQACTNAKQRAQLFRSTYKKQ